MDRRSFIKKAGVASAGAAASAVLAAPAIAQETLTIGIMVPTTGSEATGIDRFFVGAMFGLPVIPGSYFS